MYGVLDSLILSGEATFGCDSFAVWLCRVVHYRQVCFEPGDESLCAYRMSIATAVIAPFAIVLERFPPLF